MRIIGIDPGTIVTGFGVVDYNGNELKYIASGIINIPPKDEMANRLELIYDSIDEKIKLYKPTEFSIETAFFNKNVQSALKIGYARGVSLLAAVHNKLNVKEYSPHEIKKSVTGKGAATKEQVQFMVAKILSLKIDKIKFDETDALAVAICYSFKSLSGIVKSKSWKDFIKANPERVIL